MWRFRPFPSLQPAAAAALAALLAASLSCRPEAPNLDSTTGRTIVCFGDSITAGVGAAPGEGYPARLSALLGTPVIDAGVSGDTASAGLARLDRDVLSRDPWLVIVELGGNDFLRGVPLTETEAALRKIADRLLKANVVPVFVELSGPLGLGPYREVYAQVRKDYGVVLVEGALADILFDPRLKSDQIHPNAAGYRQLAEAVADQVRPLAEARSGR
jgi:acyl-CoA thioesterase-1